MKDLSYFCILIVPSGGGSVGGAINRSNSKEEVSVSVRNGVRMGVH